jgi:hypothetical protein
MAWIKRNLLFTIGGAIALLLLGAAAFYNFKGWDHNVGAKRHLSEIYDQLKSIAAKKPAPGDGKKINNTQTAKDQEKEVRAWIEKTGNIFQPIAAIPNTPEVTSEAYASALRRMIDQLQHEADTASVLLPPKYSFSFEAERYIVRFAPGSLEPLAVQLGEVKAIAEVLFAARVNALDSIQRMRVSDDDIAGSQADYIAGPAITNDLVIMTPYAVTFRSFTPELAAVLDGFAASPNGFIIKGINVSPAGMASAMASYGGGGRGEGWAPGEGFAAPVSPATGVGTGSRGGMQSFLNEQLLRVTLEVMIVKPLLKK